MILFNFSKINVSSNSNYIYFSLETEFSSFLYMFMQIIYHKTMSGNDVLLEFYCMLFALRED